LGGHPPLWRSRAGWHWIDPVASLAVNAIIVWSTWGLLRDSANLALDAVPAGIDAAAVRRYLEGLAGIAAVHDLHIWALSTTETALTVHLVKPGAQLDDNLLARVNDELRERFGISHTTIQCERGDAAFPCRFESKDVI
jgi:cobalt-zinc-cadmium efflux system protein